MSDTDPAPRCTECGGEVWRWAKAMATGNLCRHHAWKEERDVRVTVDVDELAKLLGDTLTARVIEIREQ